MEDAVCQFLFVLLLRSGFLCMKMKNRGRRSDLRGHVPRNCTDISLGLILVLSTSCANSRTPFFPALQLAKTCTSEGTTTRQTHIHLSLRQWGRTQVRRRGGCEISRNYEDTPSWTWRAWHMIRSQFPNSRQLSYSEGLHGTRSRSML